jgi:hypothetical protein
MAARSRDDSFIAELGSNVRVRRCRRGYAGVTLAFLIVGSKDL